MKYLSILCLIFLFSCEKEKLKDESTILIGKWKWSYTAIHMNSTCAQSWPFQDEESYYEVINPTTENTNYYIEFLEKGKVIFSQEQTELSEEKILWVMSEISTSKYFYEMYFDDSLMLDGIINQDTLMENRLFPFPDTDCDDYTNFFVRE